MGTRAINDHNENIAKVRNLQNLAHSPIHSEECKQNFHAEGFPTQIASTVKQKFIRLQEKNDNENNDDCKVKFVASLNPRPSVLQKKLATNTNACISYDKINEIPLHRPAMLQSLEALGHYKVQIGKEDFLQEHGDEIDEFAIPPLAALKLSTGDKHENYLKDAVDGSNPLMSLVNSQLQCASAHFSKTSNPMITVLQQERQQYDFCHDSDTHTIDMTQVNSLPCPRCGKLLCETFNKSRKSSIDTNSQKICVNQNSINEYDTFNESPSSQRSSMYDSVYELINPRPNTQLSERSICKIYAQCTSAESQFTTVRRREISLNSMDRNEKKKDDLDIKIESLRSNNAGSSLKLHHIPKEIGEKFLVKSLVTINDGENCGICVKCNNSVIGENSGCIAMDKMYHIICFACTECQINLQGKPFYALEGKPYCEYDYLQTLEKCSICAKPILERILRATGKPYHPQCFVCVVCGKSLDGVPFTVDATNQNYCIADFHKKYAPRCCVCKFPIMPKTGQEETIRVVALDRSFHFECYKCEDCGLLLSSDAEVRGCYPLDGHVLCKTCNTKRVHVLTNRMAKEL